MAQPSDIIKTHFFTSPLFHRIDVLWYNMSMDNIEGSAPVNDKEEALLKQELEFEMAKNQDVVVLHGKDARGGLRPNAGRPRGSKNKLTKQAKVMETSVKSRILKNIDDLVNAQLSLAKGQFYMYEIKMRNVGGRRRPEHILVKDPKRIKAFLDGELEGEYHYITAKSPDNKAIEALLDRALGKATTDKQNDLGLSVNIINYETKERIANPTRVYLPGEDGILREQETKTYGNNDSAQIQSEGLSVGVPESTPEVQDSGVAPKVG